MVHSCCAVGCTNRVGKSSVSFYRFPANLEQRQKWIAAVKRDGWQPTSATRLCSAHFAKGKRDLNPLSPDFVPSLFSHTSTKERKRRIRAMAIFERRDITKRKRPEAEYKAVAAKALANLGVGSVEGFDNTNISTVQGGNAYQYPLRKFVIDVRDPNLVMPSVMPGNVNNSSDGFVSNALDSDLTIASVKSENVNNPSDSFVSNVLDPDMTKASVTSKNVNNPSNRFVRNVLDPNLTTASVKSENVYKTSDNFVSSVVDPDFTIASVKSENVNNLSDSFVSNVLDPDLTTASVKSKDGYSPSDTLDQSLNTDLSITVKSENDSADYALDSDSCITVKIESIETTSENFVNSDELDNIISPFVTLVDKAQNTDSHTTDRSTMTDVHGSYIKSLELECQALRSKCHDLEDKKNRLSLSEESFQDSDAKVKYYTGLPTFDMLMDTFGFISDHLKEQSSLTKFQQYIMTLMRIRLNHSMQDLAYRFDVSSSTVSRMFHYVIHVCTTRLVPSLVIWPKRENTKYNLPVALKNEFPRCVAIINCLEIPIEKPSSVNARKQTYSRHKAQNTMKYLIAVSPQGLISYISRGWGGSYSDKYITEHCGILDKLAPEDEILADKGFNKGTCVGLYGAAYTEGKKELCMIEVEKTQNMAEVQSYVERVMGVVHAARQKYVMLQSVVSVSFLKEVANTGLTALDKVVCVACALSSVSESMAA